MSERLRQGFLLSDYEKVKKEYEAIETEDAKSAYILERRRIMVDIEKVRFLGWIMPI